MSAAKSGSTQQRLPFEEAEGNLAERRARLLNAIALANGDLYLREFVIWVFNATHGGLPGERLYKSYSELAQRPLGLCCSPGKARTTAYRAVDLRLVDCQEQRAASGSQKPNAYWIDWPGVTDCLGYQRRRSRAAADATTAQPPATTAQPPATTAQPPATTWQHTKEDSRLSPVLLPSSQAGQARRAADLDSSAADGASAGPWDASARACVREAIAAVGFKRYESLAHEAEFTLGLPAAEVLAVCEEYRANRQRFTGPGAIAYRLREQDWPVEGVTSAAKRHALVADELQERLLGELRELVVTGRRQQIGDEAIRSLVRSKLPLEFCEREGW